MNNCRIEKNDSGFKILGAISFDTVTGIYKQGTTLLETCEKVQLDFAEVAHVDSSAIALLLSWLRFAKKNGKTFVFLNLPGQLLEIANVCEVMPLLEQYISNNK